MIRQLQMTMDGKVKDKVEIAIQRLKAFEPPEGYFLSMSFGKDSQCCYHLCQMAGVKFDAHYAVTSVDPPELIRFGKEHYPDVKFEHQYYDDNKPEHYYADGRPRTITMWSLIPEKLMPPTRLVRYCCEKLKEAHGEGRVTVTGVRWEESVNRKANQALITFPSRSKKLRHEMENLGANFTKTNRGGWC